MHIQRRVLACIVLFILLGMSALPTFGYAHPDAVTASGQGLAPLLQPRADQAIPDRYIVVMKQKITPKAKAMLEQTVGQAGGTIHHRYTAALNGFAATLSPQQLDDLRRNPQVAYVEADQLVALNGASTSQNIETQTISIAQSPSPWGLDRIDQHNLPLNNTYSMSSSGAPFIHVYVIDSGVRMTHVDFGGRVSAWGYSSINDGRGLNDCNGDGTNIAGVAAGSTYGVSKNVTINSVRVFDCNGVGTLSGIIGGINWITVNHVTPAVANLNFDVGTISTALDDAINTSITAGTTYVVAAGDNGTNACNTSPAHISAAITVAASTSFDTRASFSNTGSCIDIFAPGQNITSASNSSDTASVVRSSTALAAAHVTGAVALYLDANAFASAATVASAIVSGATPNKITNPGTGSPNRLLYSILTPGSCDGHLATIMGTGDNDTITGTSGDDVIVAYGGNDTINSQGGNDYICGDAGVDTVSAGSGDDKIYGDDGDDWLNGEQGNDTILGGNGNDYIDGGDGNDSLDGELDFDTIDGNTGTDTCSGEITLNCP